MDWIYFLKALLNPVCATRGVSSVHTAQAHFVLIVGWVMLIFSVMVCFALFNQGVNLMLLCAFVHLFG